MTREHLILSGFIVLVVAVFIVVIRKGIHSRQRFLGGVCALVILSALAIGLHCIRDEGGTMIDFTNTSLSLPEVGLGILFIGLACLGCMCADQRE